MSPPSASLNSLNELNGTTQRCSGPSQRVQCLLFTFRMLAVPTSGSIRNSSLNSTALGLQLLCPLFRRVHQGLRCVAKKPDIRTALADIMGLTKINYNSCNFNDGLPVTVRFARMVGDVLTMGSAKGEEKQPFKFYV